MPAPLEVKGKFEQDPARREDILTMELGTDGLQKLFASGSVWISGLRNSGMGGLDRLSLLKNLLIRHAAA